MAVNRHRAELEITLAGVFRSMPEVRLVYLFGSRVDDVVGPLSDHDFGILFDGGKFSSGLVAEVAHKLSKALKSDRVDVVSLNRTPVELAYSVIFQGELIYEFDRATRVEYEARILGLYGDYLPVLRQQRRDILQGEWLTPEFSGIERRLDELNERLTRLQPLREKSRAEFDQDPYLRDIVERNLEVAAQCCINISHRIISLEKAQKPQDYYEAIIRMGELAVLPLISPKSWHQ